MKAKYQIVLSKAVVGVDRHIQSIYKSHIEKKNCLSSHSCHFVFFLTKLLHAYVQCVYIVKTMYQIAESEAVVGVDRPMKALSMHMQKRYCGNIVKFS